MTPAAPDPLVALRSGPLHRFSGRPHPDIPPLTASVYAIWLDEKVFAYASMDCIGRSNFRPPGGVKPGHSGAPRPTS